MDIREDGVIYYKDSEENIINKSMIIKSEDDNRYLLIPLETSNSNNPTTRGLFGGKEKFKDCFERRMGSTLGISMLLFSGFAGPEGPLGVGIGGALSCALWTPN